MAWTYLAGNVMCSGWPAQPCCSSLHAGEPFKLTSKFICECWGGYWGPVTDFRFCKWNKFILLCGDSEMV